MNSAMAYHHHGAITYSSIYSRNDGGNVDDILRRLGNVETDVSELKAEVKAISAILPHLATKADLKAEIASVRAEIGDLRAEMKTENGILRTQIESVRTEIESVRTEIATVRTDIANVKTTVATLESTIIKWFVGTTLTAVGLASGIAFSIARFVH